METFNISEAFQKLKMLDESVFDLSKEEDIDKAEEFIDNDEEDDTVSIIDLDAEDEEDIKDSYLGNVILDCNICHSKIYKDKEEVVLCDDGECANKEEECPYCYSLEGFKVIGEIAPFNAEGTEEKEETPKLDDEEKFDVEIDGEDIPVEPIEDKKRDKEIEESLNEFFFYCHDCGGAVNTNDSDGHGGYKCTSCGKYVPIKVLSDSATTGVRESCGIKAKSTRFKKSGKNKIDNARTNESFDNEVKVGDRIVIINMDGEPRYAGRSGVVKHIDDMGQIHGTWGGCALIPGTDAYEVQPLDESFNKVNIETDTDIMEMSSDDTGKVTVTTQPKQETIAPVTVKTEDEILDNNKEVIEDETDDMEPEEPIRHPEEPENNIDYEVDEFSEDEFDGLGESYLKKLYENVKSFKTTDVSQQGNNIIVEGIITFNGNKKKSTKFVFEAYDATNDGKVRFVGMNENFSNTKKSYVLTGKVSNKKFISESLNYNYNINGARVCGTVKTKK